MFKPTPGTYLYSPSDLVLFERSPFASWMARLAIDKPEQIAGIEKDQDKMMSLLADKGLQHEAYYLEKFKKDLGADNVCEITTDKKLRATDTLKAMSAGYQVIFQAYLERDNFAGSADFLIRKESASSLGNYYYEAWDTKLSQSTKTYFIIQLCCYSWMLEAVQGKVPEHAVVVLGNKKEETYPLAAYYPYFLNLKQQFLKAQAAFQSDWAMMPDLALCSDYGVWSTFAKEQLKQSDSLALVANIRKSQIKKLLDIGVNTLSDLAATEQANIKGISLDTFNKLKAQAAIQLASRGQENPLFTVLNDNDGKGLSGLPPKSRLDIYFDIEGHPLVVGGLEYLWGVSFEDTKAAQGKQYAFKDWWAHDQNQEKLAFEGFIDWSYQRWQQDSTLHIYHYASYEITAIDKMVRRYETRQDQVAELLANHVFVDLYKVVKSGLLIGEPKYSIKNVEHLYRGKRTTEVANGGDSIVFYENWYSHGGLENWTEQANGYQSWLKNPDQFDWQPWTTLQEIRSYNIDDCESTLELVDWLREQQQHHAISFTVGEVISKVDRQKTDKQLENEQIRQALIRRQQALLDQFEAQADLKADPQAELLASMLHFYERERKPKNFTYVKRELKTNEELFEDDTVVFDLSLTSQEEKDGKISCVALFKNDQPLRTDKLGTATIKGTAAKVSKISIAEHDDDYSQISFVLNADQEDALQHIPLSLFADEPHILTDTLENRLCDITEAYFETRQLPPLLATIINQANPRFTGQLTPLPISRQQYPDNDDYLSAIIYAVKAMNETCLCIQGPPGAGKTYTAEKVITQLIKQGCRVGIMSNSHAAIMNLLVAVSKSSPDIPMAKVGGFDTQAVFIKNFPAEYYPKLAYRGAMSFTQKQPYESFKVVGATVYAFAKEIAYEAPLEYLFVDEASQVALANLLAVSGAAKNIILMGDQMQLEQPIQGSHPGLSGASALEYMLMEHAVIPDDKGIFLERTYRMHPDVCAPLSEIVYEGKLQADADNSKQTITIPKSSLITKAYGILTVNVQHEGNTQSSEEEVQLVQQLIAELKTGTFTNKKGEQSPITDADILVIAPYNMQVNLLKEKLGNALKIGTIDKFQGQEAPVVIISMAVSNIEESPRGLDFVFDINRLNVAVSRAQALAIIVANEGLEQCKVNSLAQMAKVGLFCRLKLNSYF
ncbi:MAG: TM0106 family RecB-like putative nuclease [Methylococcaceae bacterium]